MSPLHRQEDGTYRWELEKGREYFIGMHHGGLLGGEDVHATYIGMFRGKHVFIRVEGDKVHDYIAEPQATAVWYGDAGDDEPSFPAVKTRYNGGVSREQKAKVLDILAECVKGDEKDDKDIQPV